MILGFGNQSIIYYHDYVVVIVQKRQVLKVKVYNKKLNNHGITVDICHLYRFTHIVPFELLVRL